MTARGVDFLENWIAKNVTEEANPLDAEALAERCIAEASELGVRRDDMEAEWGSVRHAILDAIVHLNEPGTPGD